MVFFQPSSWGGWEDSRCCCWRRVRLRCSWRFRRAKNSTARCSASNAFFGVSGLLRFTRPFLLKAAAADVATVFVVVVVFLLEFRATMKTTSDESESESSSKSIVSCWFVTVRLDWAWVLLVLVLDLDLVLCFEHVLLGAAAAAGRGCCCSFLLVRAA